MGITRMPRLPDASALGPRPQMQPGGVPSGYGALSQAVAQRGAITEELSRTLLSAGEHIQAAQQRIQSRDDAYAIATATNAFNEYAVNELRRLQTERDFGDNETAIQYTKGLNELAQNTISGFHGSEDGRAKLATHLAEMRAQYVDKSTVLALDAKTKRVERSIGETINSLSANVYGDPSRLGSSFSELDRAIDRVSGGMTPEQELDSRTKGRQLITVRAVDALLDNGDTEGAAALMERTPGIENILAPSQMAAITKRITESRNAEKNAILKARDDRAYVRAYLGREPTPVELASKLFPGAPDAAETPAQTKRKWEDFLGRPLTEDEIYKITPFAKNSGEAGMQSPPGKLVEDRQRFIRQYGANSEAVRAFDMAAAQNQDGAPKLSDVNSMRGQFVNLSNNFVQTRDAMVRIDAATKETNAASDLALIFSFMRMLDPTSVVREGEQATAENARGVPEAIRNTYNRLLTGERLAPQQRGDFKRQAELIFRGAAAAQMHLEQSYRDIATRQSMDPNNVVIDLIGQYRAALGGPDFPTGGTRGQDNQTTTRVPQYDLDGNPIGVTGGK